MIDTVWSNLKGFFNSTFFAVAVVGLIATVYSEAWLPSKADRTERWNILFELEYRCKQSLENSEQAAAYLNGQKSALTEFAGRRFREIALRYASLGGQQGQEFIRIGMMEDNELGEQAARIQKLIHSAIAEEGFDFGNTHAEPEVNQMSDETGMWVMWILGGTAILTVANFVLLVCIICGVIAGKRVKK